MKFLICLVAATGISIAFAKGVYYKGIFFCIQIYMYFCIKSSKLIILSLSDEEVFKCPFSEGTFNHQNCNKFWHCTDGVAQEKDCPPSIPPLIFEEHPENEHHDGRCVWPEESTREECLGGTLFAI